MSTFAHSHQAAAVTFADVKRAARRIATQVHRTTVATCETLNRLSGHQLFFKCENLQRTGAFKFRGAVNALSQLAPEQLARGVVTHSSGNHAQALALAARLFGATARIVMPTTASPVKREAVVEYGGVVIECEPNLAAREETAASVQRETGAELIPPYDDPRIIAGQGTATWELLQQVPQLDIVIAPVGGGGLLSGTAIAARGISPRTRVFGAEPLGADDAARSFKSGQWIPQTNPQTVADGLLTSLGNLTWPIIKSQVHDILTVSDSDTIAAMKLFWERTKILIEPSSAVAVAAALSEPICSIPGPLNIGIILSGGNVDLRRLPW
ncbi:MAG TPA: pyridoxal-phosphate dependent enzyme [Pirellulaceae bacterium]|nr:pyridoxal-phosphate dependent enzyme [Pirellulaceae bacterium]